MKPKFTLPACSSDKVTQEEWDRIFGDKEPEPNKQIVYYDPAALEILRKIVTR